MNTTNNSNATTDNHEARPRVLQDMANPKDATPAEANTSVAGAHTCNNSNLKMHEDHDVGQDKKCAPDAIFKKIASDDAGDVPKDIPDEEPTPSDDANDVPEDVPDDEPKDESNDTPDDEQNEVHASNDIHASNDLPNNFQDGLHVLNGELNDVLQSNTNERKRRHEEFVAARRRSTELHHIKIGTELMANMEDEESLPGDAAAG